MACHQHPIVILIAILVLIFDVVNIDIDILLLLSLNASITILNQHAFVDSSLPSVAHNGLVSLTYGKRGGHRARTHVHIHDTTQWYSDWQQTNCDVSRLKHNTYTYMVDAPLTFHFVRANRRLTLIDITKSISSIHQLGRCA